MNYVEETDGIIESKVMNFDFRGQGGEYFKIWIVNILLSVITLGVYSAWAKVRRKRYFYGSLLLDGSAFEYLADPVKILKGRAIVFTMYILWIGISSVFPPLGSLILIVFSFVMPFIINRSLRFNAYNSSYRNVRFGYNATYWEAFLNFVAFGLLAGLSLGLLYPFYIYNMKKFIVNHSRFGRQKFEFDGKVADMYWIFGKTIVIGLIIFVLVVVFTTVAGTGGFAMGSVGALFAYLLILSSVPVVIGYLRCVQLNYVLSSIQIKGSRLSCFMKPSTYVWISVTNYIGIAVTLGLFIPYSVIRILKYRYDNMKFFVKGDMGAMVAAESESIGAFGEEFDDFFDIDFGL